MTRRGRGVLLAAVAAFVVARTFGVPELQIASLAMLLLVVGAAVVVWTTAARIGLDRTISPAMLWHGQRATVSLTLRNLARLPSPAAHLSDIVPAGFGPSPRVRLGSLEPGGRATVDYELTASQRGTATIGPTTMRTADPFGLVARTVTLPATSRVTVYPRVVRLPAGLPLGGATSGGRGDRRRTTSGGEELADVREYVHGDDLRSVHWPSTAHRGRLMVRRGESALSPRAVLLLDVRRDRHLGAGPTASIETAVTAAASATYHLATRGRAVVVLDRPVEAVPRPAPWDQLLARLADVTALSVDWPATLTQVGKGLVGDGTLVAVVTTPDASDLRHLVRAARGFSTRVAIVVDVASHGRRGPDPAADTAVDALRAAGFRATVIRQGDAVEVRWRELLARPRTATTVAAP